MNRFSSVRGAVVTAFAGGWPAVGWLVVGWLVVAATATAAEPRVSVQLRPDPVGLEEAVQLDITAEGADPNLYFDATFQLENLRRVGGPSNLTRVQIVNGVPSNSRTLSWRLQPQAVGPARVFDVKVQVGDQEVRASDIGVTIQAESVAEGRGRRRSIDPFDNLDNDSLDRLFGRRPRRREAPKIFLRAVASPRQAWVGQQVLYTLYLYTQIDILAIPSQELPDYQGFWAREVPNPQPRPPEMVTHEDEQFARFVLEQRALFPRRGGTFELAAARTRLVARDSSFRSLLSSTTEIDRTSNAITLEVEPLPEPAPPGFTGAVGRLELTGELEPAQLAVGEAATLTLTLAGSGHFQGVEVPTLPELPGVKVFPPQQEGSDRVRGTTVVGQRSWSFVLVPERPLELTLPAIEISYFDPQTGTYEVAAVCDLTLTATSAASLPQAGGDMISLHPIRTAALPAARTTTAIARFHPWLFAAPWILAGLVWAVRRRGGSGSRPAHRALLDGLDGAGREDDPRRAAAAIEEAWRSYLEARWEIPPSTPNTRWQAALAERGPREDEAAQLVALGDDLHYLRYAPKLSSTDDLRRDLLARSRKLARRLK